MCYFDGSLRRSEKTKCKSGDAPRQSAKVVKWWSAPIIAQSQRGCQVFFEALVQLTQFKELAWPLSHPGIIAQSQRVCQVLN